MDEVLSVLKSIKACTLIEARRTSEEKMSHTPIPWMWKKTNIVSVGIGLDDPMTASTLASMHGYDEISIPNAEFIVKACNFHDKLVHLCDKLIECVCCPNKVTKEAEELLSEIYKQGQ